MMPSMRCRDSVFMSRNSTPSTDSLVRCAMVSRGMVLLSAGSLHDAHTPQPNPSFRHPVFDLRCDKAAGLGPFL